MTESSQTEHSLNTDEDVFNESRRLFFFLILLVRITLESINCSIKCNVMNK